jgi:hypothetical protein
MQYTVFIQANDKQYIGALVAEHALKRNSRNPEKFDVQIMHTKDFPFLLQGEGKVYLNAGVKRTWLNDDLQSFTPTRFMPPRLMNYEGRALVIDPDVFAVGDAWELLSRDMQGKAIMCRQRSNTKGKVEGCHATSVMLLDCAKLPHWDAEQQFNDMFSMKLDYKDWVCLLNEDPDTIGMFETVWNDFDRLEDDTMMVHNTKRQTQPWKTGLPIDFRKSDRLRLFPPRGWGRWLKRHLLGDYAFAGHYKSHPDPKQEQFFFSLLRECVEKGTVTEDMVRDAMRHNYVRHDAFEVMERTRPSAAA